MVVVCATKTKEAQAWKKKRANGEGNIRKRKDGRWEGRYTLGTWLQTWYELYAKPHLRFSTAEYYRRGIELHITPRIGDIPLKKLTGRDLQGLCKDSTRICRSMDGCGKRRGASSRG